MTNNFQTGLDQLLDSPDQLKKLGDAIGYLGHEASVTSLLQPGYLALQNKIGARLKCLFGPQHGFSTLDQDNMIETDHQKHPQLGIPIYSLYSEVRKPTPEMLDGIDTLIIDLQDVGTRVYTYIWTLYLSMEACKQAGVKLLVLDRPNPIGGINLEGTLPLSNWYSFVCLEKIPMRHSLTIGELAYYFAGVLGYENGTRVITMSDWHRAMHWTDTGRAWVNPSPNLPTYAGCLVYPGSVLIEGTNLSEGRGTTRSLEMFGHPAIDSIPTANHLNKLLKQNDIHGIVLRPTQYKPTHDKFMGQACGGFQMHCTDPLNSQAWLATQLILQFLFQEGKIPAFWNTEAYEYETNGLAIDYINGGDSIRKWIENKDSFSTLKEMETTDTQDFKITRKELLIYP